LALGFALLAGLACDENAPTETRAPAGRTDGGATGDQAGLAFQGDVVPLAITLPVNQSVATTAPNPAFRINQTGTGPNGIFQITRSASTQSALQGLTNGLGRAGFFRLTNTANTQPALQAETNGSGAAVKGVSTGSGNAGGFEISNPSSSAAALAATNNGHGPAIFGFTAGTGPAGQFQIFNSASQNAALDAVSNNKGFAFRATQNGSGNGGLIRILNSSNSSRALQVSTNGPGIGLQVSAPSSGIALNVIGQSLFQGDLAITGTLSKGAGSFRIDHPLDPEHKYLQHSFVESPDMMNVYNGIVTLDASGRATVDLPEYFEALNRDFRYQLTAVGSPGPNLYIAEGVKLNRFRIAGGRPYAHVSWQVTGVRQDAYANAHRIRVEEEKPPAARNLAATR
jgi:hypothetical protein